MFPFHRLAPDVFDTIAHYVGTADPLGPPASLASFLRTDRFIYSHLNPRQNPHLWANLFRHSFDMAALRRRFPSDWLTSSCLANEFERRWKSLARIRKTARTNNWTKKVYRESHIAEDMLTVFLMLTESDGKNAIQLIQWANVDDWISSYTYKFFVEALTRNPRMPPEKPIWSLALWITWMLTDYELLATEKNAQHYKWISTAYMLGTFAYKNTYAPWIYPLLPLSPNLQEQYARSAHVISHFNPVADDGRPAFQSRYLAADHAPTILPPALDTFTYLGQSFPIAAPLASHAATMIYFSRLQARPMYNQNNPPVLDEVQPTQTPANFWLQELKDREAVPGAKISSGVSSLTDSRLTADLDRVEGARSFAPSFIHMRLPSLARSSSWDDDVLRMMTCRNPFVGGRMYQELGAPRYRWKKGSLSGGWDGRFLLGNHESYLLVMNGENALNALEDTIYTQDFQSWSINEHYHVAPGSLQEQHRKTLAVSRYPRLGPPIHPGQPPNGFVVPHFDIEQFEEEIVAKDVRPLTAGAAVYRTWKWGLRGNDVDASSDPDVNMITSIQEADEEDLSDDVEDGYIKVVITADAIARPSTVPSLPTSMPIGSKLTGTVRLWDGMIVLRATPAGLSEGDRAGGHWTWRGYLQGDGNFIGRWREGTFDVRGNAYEGVFCLRRRVLEEEVAA